MERIWWIVLCLMVVTTLYMVGYLASNTDSMVVSAYFGPLAQLAEQLTLNQQVQGSSPWRLTD